MASCRQRTRSIVVKHKDMVEIPMSLNCKAIIDTSLECCLIGVSWPNSSATSMRNDDHDHVRTRLVRIECDDKTSQPSCDDNECQLFESIMSTFEHDIVEHQRSCNQAKVVSCRDVLRERRAIKSMIISYAITRIRKTSFETDWIELTTCVRKRKKTKRIVACLGSSSACIDGASTT
jgi:hypothetical protein